MKIEIEKKGFSLIEILLYLSVIIFLSVIAFILYIKVSERYFLSNEVSHLQNLKLSLDQIQNLNDVTFSNDFYKSISISNNSNGDILDQWKGIIVLSKDDNGNDYTISYSNLSLFNCSELSHDGLSIFKFVTINNTLLSRTTIYTKSTPCKKNGNTLLFENFDSESSSSKSSDESDDISETTENSETQKSILVNAPWGYAIIQQSQSGYLKNGDYEISLNESSIGGASSVISSDSFLSKLLKNYIDSNKGTISNGDLENYIYSIGDGYSDQIDGKSISFKNTDVPKALCNNGGFYCHITKNSDGTYTTTATFSKKLKYSY